MVTKSNFKIFIKLSIVLVLFSCKSSGNTEQALETSGNIAKYKHGMTMITPAEQWKEGLPSGNGTIGALVYGSISEERVLFNHNELWYGGKVEDVPDVSAELSLVRKLMLDGKYVEANNHYTKKLKEEGFSAKNAMYHPAFDMLLSTESEYMFQDYSRTLDFETGEIEVKWKDGKKQFSRRLFVSIPDNVSVMSIKADKKNAVSGDVTLDIHDLKDAIAQNGVSFDPGFRYESFANEGYVAFHSNGSDGGQFGGVLRVIAKNGKQESLNQTVSSKRKSEGYKAKESGVITFNSADEVILIVGFFANEQSVIAIPRLKKELAEMTSDYEVLFNKHKPLHSEKFNRVHVNLNLDGPQDTPNEILLLDAYRNLPSNELTQKLFDYGRYLLISSSRAGGYPANLQGLWNGDYSPPWSSLYGINENLQMTYWQGLPGDLKESMMAFYDYFDAHLDDFRYNAKQLWGTEGIYIPPFMSPDSGKLRHTAAHVVNWTDAAGWLASFYYDYYLFTGDEDFLRNRAIPFMKEVAFFYEGFIVKGVDGKNMLFPSQSPENQPANMDVLNPITGRTEGVKVQINSTIAIAISKEVLTNLITSCELLGVEKKAVKRWKILLADMPEYQINKDGALKEWIHPDFEDNYEHRHQSHIYPLFPGHEITEESNPELYDASKVAIEKRLRIGLKSQTGWSLAHMANVYARLGDGDKAEEALNILMRSCLGKNFFTYHNDWRKMGVTLDFTWGRTAPFQMDANFGITAAVSEMLCSSTDNMLQILPALPTNWTNGEFNNMLTRVGVRTSVSWNMTKKSIEIVLLAERNTGFDLKLPGKVFQIESNQPDILKESKYGDNYRTINLIKDQEISIQIKLQ